MLKSEGSFLGRGWSFPPEFTAGGHTLILAEDIEDIQQSLEILFGTSLGERIMQEDYGSSLINFQFEEISVGVLNQLRNQIKEAVLYHESRINVNDVKINVDEAQAGLLHINLDFTVPTSNSRYNLVYPFYLTEANV